MTFPQVPTPPCEHSDRFHAAIQSFNHANLQDPHKVRVNQSYYPHEWLYAQRLLSWTLRLEPSPSETLLLAVHCQHLCRWMIPRHEYPATRGGYHRWRNDLKAFHARKSAEILRKNGYEEAIIERVKALNLKACPPGDQEAQTMEDALCLVFLEYQLGDLAQKYGPEKTVNALRKSWKKMSDPARQQALQLSYPPEQMSLLQEALKEDPAGDKRHGP